MQFTTDSGKVTLTMFTALHNYAGNHMGVLGFLGCFSTSPCSLQLWDLLVVPHPGRDQVGLPAFSKPDSVTAGVEAKIS